MKLKSFFFLLAFLLIVVWILLLFIATEENGWRFYVIEGITTVSLVYLVYFYQKVIKPLNSIAGGWTCFRHKTSAADWHLLDNGKPTASFLSSTA